MMMTPEPVSTSMPPTLSSSGSLDSLMDDLYEEIDDSELVGGKTHLTFSARIARRLARHNEKDHRVSTLHRSMKGDHHHHQHHRRDRLLNLLSTRQIHTAMMLKQSMMVKDSTPALKQSLIKDLPQELQAELMTEGLSAATEEMIKIQSKYKSCQVLMRCEMPLEVRLTNVTYTVPVNLDVKIQTVFNSSVLYPMYKYFKRKWHGMTRKIPVIVQKQVLKNVSLHLRPGKMYLVLGPPRSGKTTLLRAIASRLRPAENETLQGTITYNGRQLSMSDDFFMENAFGYISQLDKHAPLLTVEETFEFACQCKQGGHLADPSSLDKVDHNELAEMWNENIVTQLVLAGLGLTGVKDTFVGDATVRGVSGGQRRRVTVGEMMMGSYPVLCGDEISTGLDAASTFDMVQMILYFGRLRKLTRIISLLQPSPETVSLFDEVIVLAEGQIIYCGPISQVEDYFASLGFVAPEFMDVADFIQTVTTDDGKDLYDPPEELRALRPNCPSIDELAELFRQSKQGMLISTALEGPPAFVWSAEESSSKDQKVSALSNAPFMKTKYANSFPRSTVLIVQRALTIWLRDKRVFIAGLVKNVLMGVSTGGVFYDTIDQISIQGALFQAGLFIMLGAMQSASGLVGDRVIFYKHTDANFYSAWPFVFGKAISNIPQVATDTIVFGTIMYYMIGLADRDDASNFFCFLGILLVFALVMNQQLAILASFADSSSMQGYSACVILLMMLFGGFIIPPNAIPTYFYFIYWWNPFAWAYRSLVVNEFRSSRWDDPNEELSSLGFVTTRNVPFGNEWIGYGFIYLALYGLMCVTLSALGLTFVRDEDSKAPPPSYVQGETDHVQAERIEVPFQKVTLTFEDLCYEVTASTKNETLKLLHNISGLFQSGRMCALMGSSGAGKTTLMDVISLRKRTGTVTGEVLLNGWPQEPVAFRRCSGFVEQFDVQAPELTVRETVLFSARLRLCPDQIESDKEVQAFVDSVIADVELKELAGCLVGTDESGGLSFEQKKRLSIAVELAASPSVVFLDEPTSGLDARSALLVVKVLRRIADSGRTICATIHQPSSTVFGMFDDLLLLKKGGYVVYHGEIGHECAALISYFENLGAPKIEIGDNPANWMLRVITSDSMGDLADAYAKSTDYAKVRGEINDIKNSRTDDNHIKYQSEYAVDVRRRQDLVTGRLQLIYWRSPVYNLGRVMISLIIAVVLGSVFIFSNPKGEYSEVDMRARISVIFLSFIIVGILAMLSVLPVMTMARDMFYRHRDAGMYSSGAMGWALGFVEKYFILASSTLFCVVFLTSSFLSNGLRSILNFWGFFTFNFAIYSYLGQAFVCCVKPLQGAFILSSVFIGLNNFFSGLIVRPQFMNTGFFQVPYAITPGRYVFEGLIMSLFSTNNHPVISTKGSPYNEYLIAQGICKVAKHPCIGTAKNYVDWFFGGEFDEANISRNVVILGCVLVMARVVTWLALRYIRFA